MKFSRVFYKKVSADEDNTFSVNNDINQIKFDKSKTYVIGSLSINPNIQTGVLLPSVERKKLSVTY